MTIHAPRLQKYSSRTPINISMPRYADLRAARAVNAAIVNLGSSLAEVGERIKRERDAAVVAELYNEWRDQDRNLLSEMMERRGQDAFGLQQKYDQEFSASLSAVEKQAQNGRQQKALQRALFQKRSQNLDKLATYEALESKRYLAEQEAGIVANGVKDGRNAGFDDMELGQIIDEVTSFVDDTHTGKPPEAVAAIKAEYAQKITVSNMLARIEQNAEAAIKDIEKNKDGLGESYYKLKDAAEKEANNQLVAKLRNELNEKHSKGETPDFDAMEDDIHSRDDVPDNLKDQVITWIRSQESEFNAREKKRRDEAVDEEMDTIFALIRSDNYIGAYEAVIRADELSQVQKYRIEKLIRQQQVQNYTSDSQIYMETAKRAMQGIASRDEIINLVGAGLSVDDAEGLLTELKKAQEPERQRFNKAKKEAFDAIEKIVLKSSQFGFVPATAEAAYNAYKDLERRLESPPQGATKYDMLDPDSPNYVVTDVIRDNALTPEEEMEALTGAWLKGQEEKIRRKPDESPEDFLKRINK